MKVIVLNGAPESGKDTLVEIGQSMVTPKCYATSTVDPIKEIALDCGWDGKKTPRARKFLSDLKDLLTDFNDYPLTHCINYINHVLYFFDGADISTEDVIFFIMCREPKEIDRIKHLFGAKTMVVRRPDIEDKRYLTSSDNDVLEYDYDYEVFNDGTIYDFEITVQNLLTQIVNEDWKTNSLELKIWDRNRY